MGRNSIQIKVVFDPHLTDVGKLFPEGWAVSYVNKPLTICSVEFPAV
jgi:hypothetical protein